MTRTLVMCMNPRSMQPCIDSYVALDTDVAFLTGYFEHQLEPVTDYLVDTLDYDFFLIGSDDCIVNQQALDRVVALLETGAPVATGWCPLATGHELANVTHEPLRGREPVSTAYVFTPVAAIERTTLVQRTWFAGMALTGMSRETWRRFPFRAIPHHEYKWLGVASDFSLSLRLQDADVPVVFHPRSRVEHVKAAWNEADPTPGRELLVGRVKAGVTLRRV